MNIATYQKRDQIKTDLLIRAEAISTPVYDNSDMWFSAWKHRNRAALETYFDQLGVLPEEVHICTMIQYERQQELVARNDHTDLLQMQEELYSIGYTQQDDEMRFSAYDRDTGIALTGEI